MGRWAREMNRKAQVKRVTTTRRPQASEWQSWWTDLNRRRRYLEVSWADMVVGWLVWWLGGLLGWTHVGWVPVVGARCCGGGPGAVQVRESWHTAGSHLLLSQIFKVYKV